ncbi:hypothetical protein DZS_40890 [Dickeya ananatis]
MKIAILSQDGSLYSCKRLCEAAEERQHDIEVLNPLSCYMNINSAAPSVHYRGRHLGHYDAVIPRIGAAITFLWHGGVTPVRNAGQHGAE